jgi:hypothetical protein
LYVNERETYLRKKKKKKENMGRAHSKNLGRTQEPGQNKLSPPKPYLLAFLLSSPLPDVSIQFYRRSPAGPLRRRPVAPSPDLLL